MDIKELQIDNLENRNFVFRDFADIYGKKLQEQSLIFDGVIFCLCTQGKLCIRIDYKEYDLSANNLFVILPKHIFTVLSQSDDLQLKILFTSLDYIRHLPIVPDFEVLKQTNMTPYLVITREQLQQLTKLYSVLEAYDTDNVRNKQIRTGLTLSLILIVVSMFENSKQEVQTPTISRAENLTRQFFSLLLQYCTRKKNVRFYADKLCITPKYLSMTVKSITGHPVQEWLNEAVMLEAKRYIKTTDLTIQQIADELHFTTSSSFVRFFKQQAGCTPSAYRKK